MKKFGETLRELRVAQELGLRETAVRVGISPAYLSRIERGKESPPRPELIKEIARILAADPDVLFRLASSTDPELEGFLHSQPKVLQLVRLMSQSNLSDHDFDELIGHVERISRSSGMDSEQSNSAA